MSTTNRPADGIITSGRGQGDYVYCFDEIYPIRLKYNKLILKDLTFVSRPGLYSSDGTFLFNGQEANSLFKSFTPQTVSRIDVLASTSTGPSASNFVTGTLIGGVALGAAAAMAPMGSTHTVKVTWRDDLDSKESIIKFNNSTGFQSFIGKLGTLMNQPNEAVPAPSSPVISSPAFSAADEILKFKKLMDDGIITQEEFDAKKKQLLGMEPTVINSAVNNSSGTNNSEYYSVTLTSHNDCKTSIAIAYLQYKHCDMSEAKHIIDCADYPFEITVTNSKSEAEEVAKKFSSTGASVEIRQRKSDGGFAVRKFKNGYEIDDEQSKVEVIDLEAKQRDPEVGDEILFGTNNGQRMRWKVLEKQDCRVLVITTEIVCKNSYHQNEENTTWSECTLRKWLNSVFINGYFTQEERDRIVPWELNNDNNPEFKTPGGINTTDKVFLLSIDEAKSLFANDQERSLDFWWLRSPGAEPICAATVVRVGTILTRGYHITSANGVRPALWLDFTSAKWSEEAQKRIDDYWEAHSDERKKLESEKKDLEEQIDALYASQTEQVAALNNEIAAIPGKTEIDVLDERIVELNNKKNTLGIFKGKEKNALQEQIDQAFADRKKVQDRMCDAKNEIEKRISDVNSEIQEKISPLQSKINNIDTELNKAR